MSFKNHLAIISALLLISIVSAFFVPKIPCDAGLFIPMCGVAYLALIIFIGVLYVTYAVVSTIIFFITKKKKWSFIRLYGISLLVSIGLLLLYYLSSPLIYSIRSKFRTSHVQKSACSNANEKNTVINQDGTKSVFDCKNGRFDGLYQLFYANGVLKKETYYINGIQNGRYVSFHPNGLINRFDEHLYNNEETSGYFITASNQGILEDVYHRTKDDKSNMIYSRPYFDERQRWNEESQRLICNKGVSEYETFTCTNDVFDGLYQRYQNKSYIGGKFDKVIWQRALFKNGILNGSYKEFDEDGYLVIEANYLNGLLQGMYYKYNKDGNVVESYEYTKGNPVLPELEHIPYIKNLYDR